MHRQKPLPVPAVLAFAQHLNLGFDDTVLRER